MKLNIIRFEEAVSPVVGVMLMLVVTIIIAAVVSGFAGSLGDSSAKTPVFTLGATFSQSDGMTISNDGGDTLGVYYLKLQWHPTTQFGNYEHKVYEVNKSIIKNAAGTQSFESGIKAFVPGETYYISQSDCAKFLQITQDGTGTDNKYTSSYYGLGNSAHVGKDFVLELIDTESGQVIASKRVKINA